MEEVGQNSLNDVCKMMEIPNLEVTKQNLDYLNSDLEQDLQKLDEANQILLRKIQEKEETIQSLEAEISMSLGQIKEKEELEQIVSEKEESLKDLELQSGKLEKKNKLLNRNIAELQKEISSRFQNVGPDQETLKQKLTELKVKVQKSAESCAKQEKKLAKVESDYQSVYQLCEDQAHYIKKYQEILRQMEKEKEVLLLEKEISKVQNNSSQIVKSGSILVETIQSNMEKTIMRKQKRIFWYRNFQCLVFMAMIFIRLMGYVFFHLQYINPDLFVDALPMVLSRDTLTRLRDVLFPSLTLEVEDVLPH